MYKTNKPIIAYKGFDKNLSCHGFQYEIGKTYSLNEKETPIVCKKGFHACKKPLEVFSYYAPSNGNRFCLVELSGYIDDSNDDKICSSCIKIVRELTIGELVNAHRKYIETNLNDNCNTGDYSIVSSTGNRSSANNIGDYSIVSSTGNRSSANNTGDYSIVSSTGNRSSASNTGDRSIASNTGDRSSASNTGAYSSASNTGKCSIVSSTGNRSSASNTGECSSASNTGACSSASNTGYRSIASNTGDCSSASNTGYRSIASNTGNFSSASNTGDRSSASNTGDRSSSEVTGRHSVAAVFGKDSKARGSIGCALFLTERGEWDGESYPIINVLAVIVDGDKVKADTWYTLKDGKLAKCI